MSRCDNHKSRRQQLPVPAPLSTSSSAHSRHSASDLGSTESFLQYCSDSEKRPPPIVVVVGDGRSRVRRVVRTATRHVTVVSLSTRHKETQTHTSHHVTAVSFPQKSLERSGSTQYELAGAPPQGSGTSTTDGASVGGYVYLQNHYAPGAHGGSAAAINYPAQQHPQMVYQIQQYPTCHQQQQQQQHHQHLHQATSGHYMQVANQYHHHHMLHGHGHHAHHHGHGGAVVIAGSGVGTGMGAGATSVMMQHHQQQQHQQQQNMHKKNSIRNGGDVLKRTRAQSAYELSQDLLEKQIELLERKYGGVRARNAAVTIQRAFRHYMMVKKFASITAMAKAEKRLSRRMVVTASSLALAEAEGNSSSTSAYGSVSTESQLEQQQQLQLTAQQQQQLQQNQQQNQQPRVTIMAGPPGAASPGLSRTPPTRSLSMRERRQLDCSPIPRSQSGASPVSIASSTASSAALASHPHVNLLHAAEPHYYNAQALPTAAAYYTSYHGSPHDLSYASSADTSLNVSWVNSSTTTTGHSPHTPYYSAAQIYMRPKGGSTTPTPSCSGSTGSGSGGSGSGSAKKVPPEVPKRTSSITAQQQSQLLLLQRQTPPPPSLLRTNGLCKTAENGSLTSVQSSGSDSSVTSADRNLNSDLGSDRSNSPHTWKRGTALNSSQQFSTHSGDSAGAAVVMGVSGAGAGYAAQMQAAVAAATAVGGLPPADDHAISSHTSAAQYEQHEQQQHEQQQLQAASAAAGVAQNYKMSETIRKRQYRVGLNLFNKKPEKGITYLIRRGFLENTPQGVARFLITRKGLSRQMIGEYLGNLQNQFNMAVLSCFAMELDLSGRQVDVALRKFQAYFRMPGEAQKIERLMEIFSHRYCECNADIVGRLRSSDTIFVLAFAIIMLNTDLHTPNLKPERRMRVEDFIKNLRGIDDCHDIDKDMLTGIYERVKSDEFKPGSDHVTQVMKVQATIVGKKPNLALPHRRLVCYCRLYEIPDVNKKERPGVHQREVFLFNDLLVITKIFSKKKTSVTYTFRNSFPLCGTVVTLLDMPNYPFCIQLSQKVDGKILITFNARNEHDRCKFAEDLKESISEMDEMESLRIEAELERQKSARNRAPGNAENRDSGVADVEVCPCPYQPGSQTAGEQAPNSADSTQQLKRSALSNSLLDMHEQFGNEKPQRRGSVGSLDSGMSISFQSTTTSNVSRENAAAIAAAANAAAAAKMRFNMPPTAAIATPSNVYAAPGMQAYTHANFVQQSQAAYMLQQQQMLQQQAQMQAQAQAQALALAQAQAQAQPVTGRIPGRERKASRTDENGRSTEV